MASSTQIIGRIYKITSSACDGVYIGSTTKQLNVRFSVHKSHYKIYLAGNMNYLTSFEVLKFVDAQIELIHEGLFNGKKDMEKFEGETIRTTPNAVNKNVAGWTGTKEEYQQQYREDNKEAIAQNIRQYYEDNQDTVHTWKKTKCICPSCGGKYTLVNKAQHFRTKKHKDAVSSSAEVSSTEPDQDDNEDEPL